MLPPSLLIFSKCLASTHTHTHTISLTLLVHTHTHIYTLFLTARAHTHAHTLKVTTLSSLSVSLSAVLARADTMEVKRGQGALKGVVENEVSDSKKIQDVF